MGLHAWSQNPLGELRLCVCDTAALLHLHLGTCICQRAHSEQKLPGVVGVGAVGCTHTPEHREDFQGWFQ